jgi:hypothetical protein
MFKWPSVHEFLGGCRVHQEPETAAATATGTSDDNDSAMPGAAASASSSMAMAATTKNKRKRRYDNILSQSTQCIREMEAVESTLP